MERINLNVPPKVRAHLRRVAKRLKLSESETARRLLVAALQDDDRRQFYGKVAASQSLALRKRQLEIVAAFEGDDG